jgi:hypothetical protein
LDGAQENQELGGIRSWRLLGPDTCYRDSGKDRGADKMK